MADDFTFRDAAGATRTGRAKDLGSGKLAPVQLVATALPTVVSCQSITVGTTAGTLASFLTGAAIPTGASHALAVIDTGGGDLRFWDDGSTPTATAGIQVSAGEAVELINLATVRIIASAAGTKVNLSFRRYDQ